MQLQASFRNPSLHDVFREQCTPRYLGMNHQYSTARPRPPPPSQELALHSSGPELELMFEAPAHPMASLIVVAEGPLVMQTPGTAAAERAAAQPAHLMRTSLDSPALAVASPRSSFSGDAAGGLQGGPCNGVDVAAALANVGSRSGSATCSIGRRLTMSSIGGEVQGMGSSTCFSWGIRLVPRFSVLGSFTASQQCRNHHPPQPHMVPGSCLPAQVQPHHMRQAMFTHPSPHPAPPHLPRRG